MSDGRIVQVRAALLLESEEAYAQSLRMYPEVHLYPALGPVDRITPPAKRGETLLGKYHVMNTAGCELRGRWQTLINYYSYKKQKADYPASSIGGYTRVLHCEEPDDIMHLVPTLRVDPLPDDIVTGYPVLNRPWGLVQWLSRMHIQEEYILMTETDQIFLAPPPMLATRERPSTYPFTYVDCTNSQFRPFCEDPRFNENQVPVELVKPIGNTPMIISVEMMLEMVPRWDRVARRIHADEAANRELGWIQEMFAVALALANTPGGPTDLLVDKCTMFQPPHEDLTIDMEKETRSVACQTGPNQRFVNISVLHYTYSSFMDAGGRPVSAGAARWQFNKRLFSEASPPVPFSMPPRGSPEGTRLVIQWMNEVGMSTEMWPWWGAHMHPHWPTA